MIAEKRNFFFSFHHQSWPPLPKSQVAVRECSDKFETPHAKTTARDGACPADTLKPCRTALIGFRSRPLAIPSNAHDACLQHLHMFEVPKLGMQVSRSITA